jgi:hypothetical protein
MSRGKDGGGEERRGSNLREQRTTAGSPARPDAVTGTSSTRAGAALELVGAAVARSVPLRDNLTRVLKSESGR